MKLNWKLLIGSGLVLIPLLLVLALGFGRDPHEVPFMLVGKPAPDFTLEQLEGNQRVVSLAELKGKPLVMNFWASWCGPCKLEHPVLEWGHGQVGEKVQFLGVVYEDTKENVGEYLKQNPSAYPQLFDPKGRVAVDYALAGVPETYFIDRDGIIRHKHVGPIGPEELLGQLAKLFPEPR